MAWFSRCCAAPLRIMTARPLWLPRLAMQGKRGEVEGKREGGLVLDQLSIKYVACDCAPLVTLSSDDAPAHALYGL
jgi:hypothetical protein